jgi:hypothetical protein
VAVQEALLLRLLQQQRQQESLLLLKPLFGKPASQSTTVNSLTAVVVQQWPSPAT